MRGLRASLPDRAATRHGTRLHRRPPLDPRDGQSRALVAQQIEIAVWTYLEVTEVGAGFGQSLVGKPSSKRHKSVMAFLSRPPTTVRQTAAAGAILAIANAAGRTRSAPTAFSPWRQENVLPARARPLHLAIPPDRTMRVNFTISPSTSRSIIATTFNALGSMNSDTRRRFLKSKTRPRPSAQTASIWDHSREASEPGSFASSPYASRSGPRRLAEREPGDLRLSVADRDQRHLPVSSATQANAGDLAKWHVDHATHSQSALLTLLQHALFVLNLGRATQGGSSASSKVGSL